MPFFKRGRLWVPSTGDDISSTRFQFLKTYGAVLVSLLSLVISFLAYRQARIGTQISQRAYVYHQAEIINTDELIKAMKQRAQVVPVHIKFIAKNLGNTPALRVQYHFSYNIPGKTCLHIAGDRPLKAITDLGPKDTESQALLFEYQNCTDQPFKAPFVTGLTGKVNYDDVFGQHHSVTVCYSILANDQSCLIAACNQQEQDVNAPVPKLPNIPVELGNWQVDEKGRLTPLAPSK